MENIDNVIHCLNSTNLTTLSLNQNHLDEKSLIKLFDNIDSPHLSELHLSTCGISGKLAEQIAKYLGSLRSRGLDTLELNGNQLGAQGVRKIVDVVESSNYTVKQIGLFANDLGGIEEDPEAGTINAGNGANEPVPPRDERTEEEKRRDESILSYQIHQRLPPILERNRRLTRRIRQAALKCLYPARLILTARPRNDHETAQRVIQDIGERSTPDTFRLLDLPPEVIYHIVRHMSDDPFAFSAAQFARLRKYAEDRSTLQKAGESIRNRLNKAGWSEQDRVKWEVREEWLKRGKWDKWELDTPIELDVDELLDKPGTWFKLSL